MSQHPFFKNGMAQNPCWNVSKDNMPVNKLFYKLKDGQHAVILISREFADFRVFETEEQARLCVEKLEHLREEMDPMWARTLFIVYR